jgi:hypothetical protein
MHNRPRRYDDDGSILVLVIGYTAIAAALIVLGIDVTKVFLARRALSAAADSAALAAAQGVDVQAIYGGPGPRCGQALPLSTVRVGQLAATSWRADRVDLLHTFTVLDDPRTTVGGGTVTVELSGEVAVPFGRVLGWLDPSRSDGLIHLSET